MSHPSYYHNWNFATSWYTKPFIGSQYIGIHTYLNSNYIVRFCMLLATRVYATLTYFLCHHCVIDIQSEVSRLMLLEPVYYVYRFSLLFCSLFYYCYLLKQDSLFFLCASSLAVRCHLVCRRNKMLLFIIIIIDCFLLLYIIVSMSVRRRKNKK